MSDKPETRSIIVEHLVKNFEVTEKQPGLVGSIKSLISPKKKTVRAIKNISFSVNHGELIGFIGPNGAGKTTTLKVLSGLLYPTGGFIQVLGHNPWKRSESFLKQITLIMGQKKQLWWDLPAIESLELNRAIYELPRREYEKTKDELVSLLGVGRLLKTPVRKLSLGQRMRLELVAALLHKPKVMFLDEPTIGLDIVVQQKLRDFIREYNKAENASILLTSHNIDDVVDLAKRVIVIDKGSILFDGDMANLTKRFAKTKTITFYLSKDIDLSPGSDSLNSLSKIGTVKSVDLPKVVINVGRTTAAVAASELLQQFPVDDLNIDEVGVEEIIRKVFKGEVSLRGKK